MNFQAPHNGGRCWLRARHFLTLTVARHCGTVPANAAGIAPVRQESQQVARPLGRGAVSTSCLCDRQEAVGRPSRPRARPHMVCDAGIRSSVSTPYVRGSLNGPVPSHGCSLVVWVRRALGRDAEIAGSGPVRSLRRPATRPARRRP